MCDTLPAALGARVVASPAARRWTAPLFRTGRNVSTNKIWGYAFLSFLARPKRWRRASLLCTVQEQHRGGRMATLAKETTDGFQGKVGIAATVETDPGQCCYGSQ